MRRLDFTKDFRIDATYEEHGAILSAVLARRAERPRLLRAHIGMSRAEVSKITLRMLHERAAARPVHAGASARRPDTAPRATRGAMSALQLSVDFQRHRCSSSRLTAPDSA